jgi:hypothetical protein
VSSNAKESAKPSVSLSVKKNNAAITLATMRQPTPAAMTVNEIANASVSSSAKESAIVGIVPMALIAETDLIARPLLLAVQMPFL